MSDIRWGLTRFFFAALAAADFSPARNVGDIQQSASASRRGRPNSTIADATGESPCVLSWISSTANITVYSQPLRARRRTRILIPQRTPDGEYLWATQIGLQLSVRRTVSSPQASLIKPFENPMRE